jgi:hypothetical protein
MSKNRHRLKLAAAHRRKAKLLLVGDASLAPHEKFFGQESAGRLDYCTSAPIDHPTAPSATW